MAIYFRVTGDENRGGNSRVDSLTQRHNQVYHHVMGPDTKKSGEPTGDNDFGYFKEVLRTQRSIVYQFQPHSQEAGVVGAGYEKDDGAAVAAANFFLRNDINAMQFNLEKMIDDL